MLTEDTSKTTTNPTEPYNRRQSSVIEENCRSHSYSISSENSYSSAISSMGPLLINSNNCLLTHDNQLMTGLTQARHSIGSIPLCKICKKVNLSNQFDICLQCHENQLTIKSNSFLFTSTDQNPDCRIMRSRSFNMGRQFSKETLQTEIETKKNVISTENKTKKKLHCNPIKYLLKLRRHRQSSTESSLISTESCLYKLLLHPKLSIEPNVVETTKFPSIPSLLVPAVSVSSCIQLSPEHIAQYKQRQIEFEHSIKELIETLTIKANENIKQIPKYWSHIKQLSLNKFQQKSNNYQLFDYFLKTAYGNKQIEHFFEENDEIKAILQVLSTTLTIVHDKYSYSTIRQLFDQEEKNMLDLLRHRLECLLSSYTDALSFIHARINYYQSHTDKEKHLDWIKIIQTDYPNLIEKISNDFLLKIPQIEQILTEMIKKFEEKNYLILLFKSIKNYFIYLSIKIFF